MSILFDEDSKIKDNKDEGIVSLFIASEIAKLSPSNLEKFKKSDSCKNLISLGILEQENIEAITNTSEIDNDVVIAVMNHAKNDGNVLFDDIIRLKKELDSKTDDLLKQYYDIAKDTVERHKAPAINKVKELVTKEKE